MKKRLLTVLTAGMLSMALTACGGSSDSASYGPAAEDMAAEYYYEPEMNAYGAEDAIMLEESGKNATESAAMTNRKLIKTVNLDVETKDYDGLLTHLETQIEELGGYIEYLDSYGSSYRHASITARIPAAKLDGFVRQIGETANITGRSESVEDVTLQYVDLDSHIRMLEEERDRLLELLSTAQTIEDMITIESRLGEVRYQLESMNSQLRTFDNQVDYSTVHIDIDEVIELTPVVELTDGERIAQGFTKSVADVLHGIKEFFIGLIINIPYIIVWGIVLAVIFVVVRIFVKFSDKRSQRLAEERRAKMQTGNYTSPYVQKPGTLTTQNNSAKSSDNSQKTE